MGGLLNSCVELFIGQQRTQRNHYSLLPSTRFLLLATQMDHGQTELDVIFVCLRSVKYERAEGVCAKGATSSAHTSSNCYFEQHLILKADHGAAGTYCLSAQDCQSGQF